MRLAVAMNILKETVRQVLRSLPYGQRVLDFPGYYRRKQYYRREAERLAKIGDREAIFKHHFEKNAWKDPESVSGAGSTARYKENIRRELPALFERLQIRSMLDAPCGDFNWFQLIDLKDSVHYPGGDIVESLISANQARYGSNSRVFRRMDIVHEPLPDVDLWLCRDCLFHLSNADATMAISNFLRSNVKYLLTTTHPLNTYNFDIPTGSFRLLNLTIAPFNFGPPLAAMDDWIEPHPVRQLAVWERETLAAALSNNRAFSQAALSPAVG